MKILYVVSEARPFVSTGGLADVAGSFPKALAESGNQCSIVIPYYKNSIGAELQEKLEYITNFNVPVGWRSQYCGIFKTDIDGVTYYLIDNEYYFKRDFGIYGYYDDAERFAFYSRAVLEMVQQLDLQPDIINSNDWQTALIPVYYSIYYKHQYNMWGIKNVFTIHNIQYQGQYGLELLEDVLSIPLHLASIMEYDGDVNFMKGAIETADKVTTVSPSYAAEILDPWYSHGLDRELKNKTYKTTGFLNGIDTELYNPETDKQLAENYSADSTRGKNLCKTKLLEELNLPAGDEPVMAMITRLVEPKGIDLVKAAAEEILNLGFKLTVLGAGDQGYEDFFRALQSAHPDKVSFTCGFDDNLARRIYAGADMFLMPSKSEPCGIAQMIAMRYGTVPVVRSIGGLKDSVPDAENEDGKGLGYTFRSYNALDMLTTINRAYNAYKDKRRWNLLVSKVMKEDFSWKQSAKLYIGLYEELCGEQKK